MKKILLICCYILTTFSSFAQQSFTCGTDELRTSTLQQNRGLAEAVVKRNNILETFTREFISEKTLRESTADTALYIIPVVFHIVHNYGNENISNEQIYSAIDILNKTFRKQRPDTGDIVAAFKPLHSDTRIEFRLAQKDPNGGCHSGINRIASSISETGGHNVKSLVQWNPSNYLNVYVVKNAAGLAGHAIFPSDADTVPEWDGIVLSHNYVGTIGTSNLTQSVAFAHECGHYLNLQHIWGGNNVPGYYFLPCADPNHDCTIDDGVSDTPPTIGWQSCNLNGASCSSPLDNVQNVMDYSYCNIMFTEGQRDRMQAALNSPIGNRNNLWQTANLIAAGIYDEPIPTCNLNFRANKTAICPGSTVTFTIENSAPSDSVLWTFEGGIPSTSTELSPEINYPVAGVYDVSFTTHVGVVWFKNDYITVLPNSGSINIPFTESFENNPSLHGMDWFENSFDIIDSWTTTIYGAYSGTWSLMVGGKDTIEDTKDELYSPLFDLSQATEINIAFKYAFAGKTSEINDELLVQLNKSCSNFWLTKLTLDSAELETAMPQTGFFIPSQEEWKQAVVSIPSSYLVDDFRFRFVFNGRGGNNLYIDDINIDIAAGVEENSYAENPLRLFPNPTTGKINIVLPQDAGQVKEVRLLDSKGLLVSLCSSSTAIDISELSSGMYFVLAATENGIYRQRVIKE